MDIRKAFVTIDHAFIFYSLHVTKLDEGYICLLQLLYRRQSSSVNGSDTFGIRCGVKQGDVLSAIIFNCVLDIAFDSWKRRLGDHGLFVAHANPRLTNTRYADDI